VGRRRAYYVRTATIHISEAEATRDFAALLTRVRGETEIVIENGTDAVAVIHTAAPVRRSAPSASGWRNSMKAKRREYLSSILTVLPTWKR